MISEIQKQAAQGSADNDGRTKRVIVSDYNSTLELGLMGANQLLIDILKKALAAGDRVITASGESVDSLKSFVQRHFTADECQKIECYDKADLRDVLRQGPDHSDPVIPDIVFDDAPDITYLDRFKAHAYILMGTVSAIRMPDIQQVASSHDDVLRRLDLGTAPVPAPAARPPSPS